MSKKTIVFIILILGLTITVILVVRHNYALSNDYNYISAKLDIKNGEVKIVHVGDSLSVEMIDDINRVAAKFGFKNVYLSSDAAKNEMKGIINYNELMETFLTIKNGEGWKINYQQQVDKISNDGKRND